MAEVRNGTFLWIPETAVYRYDLHVHSSERSPCAVSAAWEMCEQAVAAGLTGIAFTEHDVWWPSDELQGLRGRYPGLTILSGVEVSCPEGHFLVFLPEPEDGASVEQTGLRDLCSRVDSLGGLLAWAHPFRYDPNPPDWLPEVALHAIEVNSSNMVPATREPAKRVSRDHGWVPLTNSDAHDRKTIGSFFNRTDRLIASEADLITCLKTLRAGWRPLRS